MNFTRSSAADYSDQPSTADQPAVISWASQPESFAIESGSLEFDFFRHPLVAPNWDLGAPAPGVHSYFFFALVKMTIGPLILSAEMLDFIPIISVR